MLVPIVIVSAASLTVAVIVVVIPVVVVVLLVFLRRLQSRPAAGRRERAAHDPVAEVETNRVHRFRVRHRIGGERSLAVTGARATRRSGRGDAKAAVAAAVLGAGDVIPPHVPGQRNVLLRIRADPFGTELESPDFGGTEMLDDLRAGVRLAAAIENAARWQPAHMVGISGPPLRALAARFVEFQHTVWHGEAEVERYAATGNDRPGAVLHLASGLVFVEAEMEEGPEVIARLRDAAPDQPMNAARQGVGGAGGVAHFVLEKRAHVAERGEADAQDRRVLRRETHLVDAV